MAMKCDLERYFGELADQIPTSDDGNHEFIFSSQTLPIPPATMQTNRLVIKKTEHHYGSYRTDLLLLYAHKKPYRHLGLLILSVVFHSQLAKVEIELTHPESQVKKLIIEYDFEPLEELPGGYHTQPYGFVYYPEEIGKHPWKHLNCNPYSLPGFSLTNAEDCLVTEEDWKNRNTLKGCGSDIGSVRFAELLLNASRPEETGNEYALEGEVGYRGVAPGSSEVTLYLPGQLFWDEIF